MKPKPKSKKPRQKMLPAPKGNMPVVIDPQALITQAIQHGGSLEMLQGLYALSERLQAKMAETAYREAMSAFQTACPIIDKKKKVMNKPDKGGGERYRYAPIEDIAEAIKPYLERFGLSFKIETPMTVDPPGIDAIVKTYHALGHCEESRFWVPTDPEAYMTEPQKWAAAATFASRNALKNAFGIFTRGEDTNTESDELKAERLEALYKEAENLIETSQTADQLSKRGAEVKKMTNAMPKDKRDALAEIYKRRMGEIKAREEKK